MRSRLLACLEGVRKEDCWVDVTRTKEVSWCVDLLALVNNMASHRY